MPVTGTPVQDIALTTLSAVKVYLGIPAATTADDARLTAMITQVSDRIKRFCDDNFIVEVHEDRMDGTGTHWLLLEHQPIIRIEQLSIGTLNVLTVINEDTTARQAFVRVDTTGIVLTIEGGSNAGSDTISLSTNTTMTLAADAITAIGKGWTGTVVATEFDAFPTADLFKDGINFECLDTAVDLEEPNDPESDFQLYPLDGKIYHPGGFPRGTQNIFVQFRTGHADIPGDLQLATNELVAYIYGQSQHDSALQMERLGDWMWQKGQGSTGESGEDFDGLMERKLARFRNFVVVS